MKVNDLEVGARVLWRSEPGAVVWIQLVAGGGVPNCDAIYGERPEPAAFPFVHRSGVWWLCPPEGGVA